MDGARPLVASPDVDRSSPSTRKTVNRETVMTESMPKESNKAVLKVSEIDTAAPFDSVKAAVSKFGGIVDWKAHCAQTVEKRKAILKELEKMQEEIPLFKKQAEDTEEAKIQLLKELDSTNRLVEELKLNLERAQKEEEQTKQDSELAKLRVEEIERGIADEVSATAKTQVEVAKARHEAAVLELNSVKGELEQLKQDCVRLVVEKDASLKNAEEAVSASQEVKKSVDDLTIELITAKEALESVHAVHMEAEEYRIGAVLMKEQDRLNWEKDLKEANKELEKVNEQILASKDLKSKLDTATTLLQDLNSEWTAYMESKLDEETAKAVNLQEEPNKNTRADVKATLSSAKQELEEVKFKIEKAVNEVNILKMAATSLKSELKKEKAELAAFQHRKGIASISVASLETELNQTKSDIALVHVKEREKMAELPKQLQALAQEADRSKALVVEASDKLYKAKEEAKQTKAGANTTDSRLRAAVKEIEAAKASEKLALAAINALVESESAQTSIDDETDSQTGVTLSLEEYYELNKRAHEAEEQANVRVSAALSQIDMAKELESKSLKKLEVANREMAERKLALQIALQKSEIENQGKLGVEQDLQKWRSDNKQRRKPAESIAAVNSKASRKTSIQSNMSVHQPTSSPKSFTSNAETNTSPDIRRIKKKKKSSFFPKIFMFFGKKKSRGSKS